MLPLWLCIPFAGLLLCIAIMPLVKAEWWESHQIHAVIFWSLLFIIPYAVTKGASTAAETVLECIINDYLSFIINVDEPSWPSGISWFLASASLYFCSSDSFVANRWFVQSDNW